MKLNEIQDMWKEDSKIDETDLGRESIRTPLLHSKYLSLLSNAKLAVRRAESEYLQLRRVKWRYYRGELSREELTNLNWEQWQGVKPMKNEMDQFLDGDEDLNNMKVKIEYLQTMLYLLESILGQIKARDWQLKTMLDHKRFLAGN